MESERVLQGRNRIATLAVVTARILFGVIAAGACLLLLFGIFLFDAPGSGNLWTWNLALAPGVYVGTYLLSLIPPVGSDGRTPTDRARLVRSFIPLLGIAWYGLALLTIQAVCHGNFVC